MLKTKPAIKIDGKRAAAASEEVLSEWFKRFASIIAAKRIQPQDYWNMDETGVALGVCSNHIVLGSIDSKRSTIRTPESREWVSIIETISALGRVLTPVAVFKGKNILSRWFTTSNIPPWRYIVSPNGWTSDDIAMGWLHHIFLPETAREDAPRLLLVDGHGSHATVEFMSECYIHNVSVVYLPAHSSHVLQPLDLAVFSSLKHSYRA